MDTSCNTSTLSVYNPSEEKPWNEQRAHHLYRRLIYGASPSLVRAALLKKPEEIVDALVDEALNTPLSTPPDWINITKKEYELSGIVLNDQNELNSEEWYIQTVNDQMNNGLRALMTIFWNNHFVTEINDYFCAGYMVQHYNVIQKHSLGNFKDFVSEIGLTNAMLVYLNGVDNNKNRPNENYARELYELFTLGEDNGYTETDIVETSKALTGYNNKNNEDELDPENNDKCTQITFSEETFDNDIKTIFGRSGNFNYDDVIDILFEEKRDLIAEFIVSKLYRFFVSPTLNTDIITELTNQFKTNFEIEPILRKLFKSEHFFDEKSMATIIKSPYDLLINLIKVTGFPITDEEKLRIYWEASATGQRFYKPVDVAGWQGDYDWINSATIIGRWDVTMTRVNAVFNEETGNPEKLSDFAKEVSQNSTDVEFVARSIIDAFIPRGLNTESDYVTAIDEFKGEVPIEFFTNGTWTLDFETVPRQMVLLFQYLVTLPEFQLK